ncbi:MAG: helix-turn-helix domain-containing protein [Nodularia sp. (in: Bacteria)]|nr:MAG: helix-turn-helix domain-containing protein [Nodularia sp. (in: cyanobacteria)]
MKPLNEAQAQQLQEITQYLLRVRQEKSISIEEIAIQTNIRLNLLKALDTGDFEALPEPVYVQGFIRRYAEAIGLDGQALANTFSINDFPDYSQNESQNLDKRPNIHIPLFVPYALLLLLAAVGLIYVLNPKLTAESPAKPENTTKTTPAPIPSSTEKPDTAPTSQDTPLTAVSPKSPVNSNVEVNLELQGDSWLQVTVDGKTEFMGNLNKGERRAWKAKENLTIRSGNAGAVLISVNQQPAQPFGNDGDVKEVTFTPETNTQ